MKTVVAAIIRRNGRILACRRRDDQDHAGKWEFPGGKVEDGETAVQALRRELAEELGVEAEIGPEIERYDFAYPGKSPIRLVFHEVTEYSGKIDLSQFADSCWAAPPDLPALDFLEGDVDFVRRLAV